MPAPRLIRCGKCHVVMGLRYFVLKHRRPNRMPCPPVPCAVCKSPVGQEGLTAYDEAVCSAVCERNHPQKVAQKADRDVADQLWAMERAQRLPAVYQRRRAS